MELLTNSASRIPFVAGILLGLTLNAVTIGLSWAL
jgi:hypothetical protein